MSTREREWTSPAGVRNRIRVNVTKNTKGFTYDRTVEVEWDGDESIGIERGRQLLSLTAAIAREDIRHQVAAEGEGGE